MPANPEAPLERVALVAGEHDVARGTVEVGWLLPVGEGWLPVARPPGARVQSLESGPGTVWQRGRELELPRRTRRVRVGARPRAARRPPLGRLARGAGPARRVIRQAYEVGLRGTLRLLKPT